MIGSLLVGFVALEHAGFLVLEVFFWRHPIGLKVFGNSAESARTSAPLAANQGLYNGFLAAGLIWSLFAEPPLAHQLQLFFLSCVAIAGTFGAATANPRIFLVQAVPALLALLALGFN